MDRPTDQQQQAADHLQDRSVLRGFAEFGSIHRAQLAAELWSDLRQQEDASIRKSLALEIVSNYVVQLEDVLHWILALRRWRQGGMSLFDCVDSVRLERSEREVDEIAGWNIADFRRELGLPLDQDLERLGYPEASIREFIQGLRIMLERVQEAVEELSLEERILPLMYHKTKHGILAVPADPQIRLRNALMLASRRGSPIEEGEGRRKINTAWIEAVEEGVAHFVRGTYALSDGIWTVANVLYHFKFDPSWQIKPWPYPEVEV